MSAFCRAFNLWFLSHGLHLNWIFGWLGLMLAFLMMPSVLDDVDDALEYGFFYVWLLMYWMHCSGFTWKQESVQKVFSVSIKDSCRRLSLRKENFASIFHQSPWENNIDIRTKYCAEGQEIIIYPKKEICWCNSSLKHSEIYI